MKVGVSLMDAREAARTARKQRAHMEARAMDAGQRIIVARDARAGHRAPPEMLGSWGDVAWPSGTEAYATTPPRIGRKVPRA